MSGDQQAPASRPPACNATAAAAAAASFSSSSAARAIPSSKRKAESEAARADAADLLIPVYLRLRPIADGATSVMPSTDRAVMFRSSERVETYTFSKVYGPTTSQTEVFDEIMKPAVSSMFETGESASLLLAYGASSSGKTFTVTGTKEEPGLLLRTVEEVLKRVGTKQVKKLFKPELWNNVSTVLGGIAKRKPPQQQKPEDDAAVDACEYSVSLSFAECYLDQVYDLQSQAGSDSKNPVKLFQHGSTESHSSKRAPATLKMDSEGRRCIAQHETRVRTLDEARIALTNALGNRTVLGTKMNDQSSRSHLLSVVKLLRVSAGADASEITVSRVAVVDLAGAERLAQSGVEGVAQSETKKINSTLHTLAKCVEALRTNQARASGKRTVVPWRECKFTQLLQPYFEYGTPAFMIHVNPAVEQARVTSEVFRFAQRAGALTQVVSQIEKPSMMNMTAAEAGRLALEVQRLQQALLESEFARVQLEARIRKASAEESQTRFRELEDQLLRANTKHRPAEAEREGKASDSVDDDDEKLDAASEMYESQISALEKIVAQLRTENTALAREVAELRSELVPPRAISSSFDEETNVDSPPKEVSSEQRDPSPNLTGSPMLSATAHKADDSVAVDPPECVDSPDHDERAMDASWHAVSVNAAAPAAEFSTLAAAAAAAAEICEASEARGQRPASRFPKPKSIAARARSRKVDNTPPATSGAAAAAEGENNAGTPGLGSLEMTGAQTVAGPPSQWDPPAPAATPKRVTLGELDARAVDERSGTAADSAGEVEVTKSTKKRKLRNRRKTGTVAADDAVGAADVIWPDTAVADPPSALWEEDPMATASPVDEDGAGGASASATTTAGSGSSTLMKGAGVKSGEMNYQPAMPPPTLSPSAGAADPIDDHENDANGERTQQRKKRKSKQRSSSSASSAPAVAPSSFSSSSARASPAVVEARETISSTTTPVRVTPAPMTTTRTTKMEDEEDVSCLVFRDAPPPPPPPPSVTTGKMPGRKKSGAASPTVSSPAIERLLAAQREECAKRAEHTAFLPPVGPSSLSTPDDGQQDEQEAAAAVTVPVKKRKLRSQKARAVDDERGMRKPRYSGVVEKLTRRG
ncbi:P-loop containing nucleoside triphosphate hydrolase protein [Geranomyces variabilis]|nr:P-loop containing nucleoside triphosphate hydrolase protein [Geranomyces variabilis]KAJ3135895.1 hypothetical protein HDU90_003636 [Geranomyces variabilis]